MFTTDGRKLSYLDHGGPGRPLLAPHGHYNEASVFAPLAAALAPRWRVIALDQRGHGESDRARGYERDGHVADVAAFQRHLGGRPRTVPGPQKALGADHWADWASVSCPTLLVRGTRSDELSAEHARDMVARRAGGARLVELPAGHCVRLDAPSRLAAEVTAFLSGDGSESRNGNGTRS
ncbi:alpha/beta hydrolase [Streptomyces sp. NRRL F-5755]|uniref:alpha/beta fold hydrolase n=1 Tax=Streptomyces sp. NRRL F-5755 TaxID=1519475 RepID=UPI0006AED62B